MKKEFDGVGMVQYLSCMSARNRKRYTLEKEVLASYWEDFQIGAAIAATILLIITITIS